MAEEYKLGVRNVSGFKMIATLLIFVLRTANLSKNLLMSMNVANKNELGE